MIFTVLGTDTKIDVTKAPIFPYVRILLNTMCETVAVIFIFQLKGYSFQGLKNNQKN